MSRVLGGRRRSKLAFQMAAGFEPSRHEVEQLHPSSAMGATTHREIPRGAICASIPGSRSVSPHGAMGDLGPESCERRRYVLPHGSAAALACLRACTAAERVRLDGNALGRAPWSLDSFSSDLASGTCRPRYRISCVGRASDCELARLHRTRSQPPTERHVTTGHSPMQGPAQTPLIRGWRATKDISAKTLLSPPMGSSAGGLPVPARCTSEHARLVQ